MEIFKNVVCAISDSRHWLMPLIGVCGLVVLVETIVDMFGEKPEG